MFACVQAREAAFTSRTKDKVYFGVGAYGNVQQRAGFCYRMSLKGVDRDVIAQVITMGGNTAPGNFNIMMVDGGFSDTYNACAFGSTQYPVFNAPSYVWGGPSGGLLNSSGCDLLPDYPTCTVNPPDSMRALCKELFVKGFRSSNYSITNPTISKMCQVACPNELVQATGLRRTDEQTAVYTCSSPNLMEPSGGFLSRSMDCSRPSYAWGVQLTNQTGRVIPCRRDGYTRINALPVVPPTPRPSVLTNYPTAVPTEEPTIGPTASPSFGEMCCEYTPYGPASKWRACNNAANPSLGNVRTCDTCLSYQCLDWTAGSAAMQKREASFAANSGIQVYFAVGSYSNDPTRAGLCYRLNVKGTTITNMFYSFQILLLSKVMARMIIIYYC